VGVDEYLWKGEVQIHTHTERAREGETKRKGAHTHQGSNFEKVNLSVRSTCQYLCPSQLTFDRIPTSLPNTENLYVCMCTCVYVCVCVCVCL